MGPNDADGMTNSVDPDQTAPLGLHCLPRHSCPTPKDHNGNFDIGGKLGQCCIAGLNFVKTCLFLRRPSGYIQNSEKIKRYIFRQKSKYRRK